MIPRTILSLSVLYGSLAICAEPLPLQFNRDVRPILSDNCFQCHGQDAGKRAADVRLDTAEGQREKRIVVAGSPETSQLIERIFSDDPDSVMPPPDSNKKLTAAQKELVKRWIVEGASFEKHWSLTPPIPREPPVVDQVNATLHNPIDQFVVAELLARGMTQSPQAERATLIRRLSLDLIGLPPSTEEVEEFCNDTSPNAYEKVVDRLLKSPHFGERLALPWLDAARYADTHGYQKDNHRTMWLWRDWVIQAMNANMPFDQFTIEQLAGDLLPNPTQSQLIATGFNRNHRINAEAGSIAEEFRSEYVSDRVETTSTVWLGLTLGCARCHDHKFDPITQKDYYQFYAFFNSIDEKGVDGVGPSPGPQIDIRLPESDEAIAAENRRIEKLKDGLQRRVEQLAQVRSKWEQQLNDTVSEVDSGEFWLVVEPNRLQSDEKLKLNIQNDGSVLVSGDNPLNDVQTIEFAFDTGSLQSLRLEALSDSSHTHGGYARSFDGSFVLSGFEVELVRKDGKSERVAIESAVASSEKTDWPIAAVLDESAVTGWSTVASPNLPTQAALFRSSKPLVGEVGSTILIRLRYESKEEQSMIGRFRIATSPSDRIELEGPATLATSVVTALRTDISRRTKSQSKLLDQAFIAQSSDSELVRLRSELQAAEEEYSKLLERAKTGVMVMKELPKKRETFVHTRGAYDQPGEKVEANTPSCLPKLPSVDTPNRLDLARWLVSPNHPLTARVAVNRYWQVYFGNGLVRTPEDYGTQGEWPTHPELLDWLAVEFVRSGWDVKALQKLIVMSATYQQSSNVDPQRLELDPDNRWLSRGARFRLPAHILRDQALATSGLLVPRIGGPPVKPFQPEGLWEGIAGINSNTTTYQMDAGDNLYRRSIYTYWKRAVPPPSMMIFDAADREICSVKRRLTNTPLQALTTLNDPTYVEASRKLAESALSTAVLNSAEDRNRIRWMVRRVIARPATVSEIDILEKALTTYRSHYQAKRDDAKQLLQVGSSQVDAGLDPVEVAAWSNLALLLLNLDEALTKE
jgi:hypothetical protein